MLAAIRRASSLVNSFDARARPLNRRAWPFVSFQESARRQASEYAAPAQDTRGMGSFQAASQGRASKIILKGVSVARLTLLKPPAPMTSRNFASPACAPRAAPTSCASEVGTHTIVEAP